MPLIIRFIYHNDIAKFTTKIKNILRKTEYAAFIQKKPSRFETALFHWLQTL